MVKNNDGLDASSVGAKRGYIFEVDLEYHNELNVFNNDYALAQ